MHMCMCKEIKYRMCVCVCVEEKVREDEKRWEG